MTQRVRMRERRERQWSQVVADLGPLVDCWRELGSRKALVRIHVTEGLAWWCRKYLCVRYDGMISRTVRAFVRRTGGIPVLLDGMPLPLANAVLLERLRDHPPAWVAKFDRPAT